MVTAAVQRRSRASSSAGVGASMTYMTDRSADWRTSTSSSPRGRPATTIWTVAGPVSCGIPGHDRTGQELVATMFTVKDPPLVWDVQGRCGFASDFSYSSES